MKILIYTIIYISLSLPLSSLRARETTSNYLESLISMGSRNPLKTAPNETFKFLPDYHGSYDLADDRCFFFEQGQRDNSRVLSFRFSEEMDISDCKKKEAGPKSISVFTDYDQRFDAQYVELDSKTMNVSYFQECWQPGALVNEKAPIQCVVANETTCKAAASPSFQWSKDFRVLQDAQRAHAKMIFDRELPPKAIKKIAPVSFGPFNIKDSFENKYINIDDEIISSVLIRFKRACMEIIGVDINIDNRYGAHGAPAKN